ncbi:MAG: ISAzo13-like element transposase-related protein [Candidatus Binatia bacterium]
MENLLEHDTAGDPMTGLKWSRRTTDKIANLLGVYGFAVSPNTVARLLHQMDYSLRVNQKARVPRCGGNSILRYPCLKYFFHNCLITNDLQSAKA